METNQAGFPSGQRVHIKSW